MKKLGTVRLGIQSLFKPAVSTPTVSASRYEFPSSDADHGEFLHPNMTVNDCVSNYEQIGEPFVAAIAVNFLHIFRHSDKPLRRLLFAKEPISRYK